MSKKIVKLLILVIVACMIADNLSAQQFYPIHFRKLYTDEDLPENDVAQLHRTYLLRAGFERQNDSLYIHPVSRESLRLTAQERELSNQIVITYLTVSDLKVFRKRLEEEYSEFEKLNPSTYRASYQGIINDFVLDRDTLINGKRFHPIKYILTYNKRHTFPLKGTYPLQHTTWYFSVYYQKSHDYSDYNDITIVCSKQKTPYKIEFVDDVNFKLTYTNKNRQSTTYFGTYVNEDTFLSFKFKNPAPVPGGKNNKKSIAIPEVVQSTPVFYGLKELEAIKGTKNYFQFIFSRDYDMDYDSGSGRLELNIIVHDGPPKSGTGPVIPLDRKSD